MAVAIAVAQQLQNFGVTTAAVRQLAEASLADERVASIVEAAAVAIETDGIPRVQLQWDNEPLRAPKPSPRRTTKASPPSVTRYVVGDLDGAGSGANARLEVSVEKVTYGKEFNDFFWRKRLRLELGDRGMQECIVPSEQPVVVVLDDLARSGWALAAVMVEESAIVGGDGFFEKSMPVKTSYYLARRDATSLHGGAS